MNDQRTATAIYAGFSLLAFVYLAVEVDRSALELALALNNGLVDTEAARSALETSGFIEKLAAGNFCAAILLFVMSLYKSGRALL